MMLIEHSQVVLNKPLPHLSLKPGYVGIVVHVHDEGAAFEVEFLTMLGNTIGVETLAAAELRQASPTAVAHERELDGL
jgi:hypothetical protein